MPDVTATSDVDITNLSDTEKSDSEFSHTDAG